MNRILKIAVALFVLAGLSPIQAQNQKNTGEKRAVLVENIGTFSRTISTDSKLAQQFFDQGLRLAYGFYYPEAVASFREALRHDPGHPMIYWGITYAAGSADPKGVGRKAISKALENIDRATQRERGFIETLAVPFDDENYPDADIRDSLYVSKARALHERYPNDPGAAVLLSYALRKMGKTWASDGSLTPHTREAAEALKQVMKTHPDHPGANHIYIHVYEGSNKPEKALPHAERIERLMPGEGHIVHMPSHILIHLGRYEDIIAHNERSIAADRAFLSAWGEHPFPSNVTTNPLSAQNHENHARSFIRLAATLQGNSARALAEARKVRQFFENNHSLFRVYFDMGLANRWFTDIWQVQIAFGKWNQVLDEQEPTSDSPYIRGFWRYSRGCAFAGLGKLEEAERELEKLTTIKKDTTLEKLYALNNPASEILKLASYDLRGRISAARGAFEEAASHLKKAVNVEDNLSYAEPPDWPLSVRLLLGSVLLADGRATEAEACYRKVLSESKNNGWALWGVWKSLEAQGETVKADNVHKRFEKAWQHADVELPILTF